jgi:bis(5'-nucleosidyl)-tetraphosphatase
MIYDESFGVIPLTQNDGEWEVFLILHKGGNHWGFPKGHRNEGETSLEAASRELYEETGLTVVKFLQETPLMERYQFRSRRSMVQKTVSYFPALVTGKFFPQQEEISDGKWVKLAEANTVLTFKEGRTICNQLIEKLDDFQKSV